MGSQSSLDELCGAALERLTKELSAKERDISDYKAEVLRIIRGESRWTVELLNEMLSTAEQEAKTLQDAIHTEQLRLAEIQQTAQALLKAYDQILTWADLYDQASTAGKKMILSQFIESIHVGRNYAIDIRFQISFEQFQQFRDVNI